jgi:ATP-dependent protease ClpP protease subunit
MPCNARSYAASAEGAAHGSASAVEIAIKWKEVLAQKNAMLEILSRTTGHSTTKLDKV